MKYADDMIDNYLYSLLSIRRLLTINKLTMSASIQQGMSKKVAIKTEDDKGRILLINVEHWKWE